MYVLLVHPCTLFSACDSLICLLLQISTFSSVDPNVILPLHQLPSLQAIYTLDAVISKVQVSLDEHLSKVAIEADTHKSTEITKNLLPATLQLTDVYTAFTRWERFTQLCCDPQANVCSTHTHLFYLAGLRMIELIWWIRNTDQKYSRVTVEDYTKKPHGLPHVTEDECKHQQMQTDLLIWVVKLHGLIQVLGMCVC